MGFSKVECDVRLTADFVPMLIHDATIEAGRIDALTWEQVHTYDPDIPIFEDFTELCHDTG
jgi:glycerophosphoryl diester phosphodiesterase